MELVNSLSVQTFCRIDARIKCLDNIYHNNSYEQVVFDDVYFIEINVMPTIRDNNNFSFSFNAIEPKDSLYPCIQIQKEMIGTVDVFSFLLASSMLSFT